MTKIRESKVGWIVKCCGKTIYSYDGDIRYRLDMAIKKKHLKYACTCGKNCKPIKVRITVEAIA